MMKNILAMIFLAGALMTGQVIAAGQHPQIDGVCDVGNCTNGVGKFISTDNDIFSGTFKKGAFTGKGEVILSTGHVYSGRFKNWVITKGRLTFPTGEIYNGDFGKDLLPSGQGTMQYTDGSFYNGEWYKGQRQGLGKMIYADKTWYNGEWASNVRDGNGVIFDGTNEINVVFRNGILQDSALF